MRAVTLALCAVARASWTRKIQKRGGATRACQEEPSLTSVPRAFDGDECARILALFDEAKEEVMLVRVRVSPVPAYVRPRRPSAKPTT